MILDLNEYVPPLAEAVYSARNKKILFQSENVQWTGKTVDELTPEIEYIFKSFQYFNSLDEHSQNLWDGRPLSNVIIPKNLSPFVYPASVRLDPTNTDTVDLLVRPKAPSRFKFAYKTYWNACKRYLKFYGSDINGNCVTLDTLRIHKSFMDVLPFITIEMKKVVPEMNEDGVYTIKENNFLVTHRNGNIPYIPIQLNESIIALFEKEYFTDEYTYQTNSYIEKMFE